MIINFLKRKYFENTFLTLIDTEHILAEKKTANILKPKLIITFDDFYFFFVVFLTNNKIC